MSEFIVGIDPGKKGGIAILCASGRLVDCHAMPATDADIAIDFLNLAHLEGTLHVVIEKAQAMPKQGVSSMFTYGKHAGFLEGLVRGLKHPFTLIQPRIWQTLMFAGTSGDLPKKRAREVVSRLWPEMDVALRKHDGICDALLIAEFGRRTSL